jgi:hypothetical protein
MESPKNDGSKNPQSGLSSAEYRAKLLTKLNCLIAVLEVAIAKISRSIDLPGTNEERLLKIRGNLENTLSICKRAKNTLVKGLDASPAKQASTSTSTTTRARKEQMSYRDYVELSSIEEYQKFKALPPIRSEELERIDIDQLVRKLFEN